MGHDRPTRDAATVSVLDGGVDGYAFPGEAAPRRLTDAEALLASIKSDIDRLVEAGRKAETESDGSLILRQHRERALEKAEKARRKPIARQSRTGVVRWSAIAACFALIAAGLAFAAVHGLGQAGDTMADMYAAQPSVAPLAVVQTETVLPPPAGPVAVSRTVLGSDPGMAPIPMGATSSITTSSITPSAPAEAAENPLVGGGADGAPRRRPSVVPRAISRRPTTDGSAASVRDHKWTGTFYER